jgi:hypothetical protein
VVVAVVVVVSVVAVVAAVAVAVAVVVVTDAKNQDILHVIALNQIYAQVQINKEVMVIIR